MVYNEQAQSRWINGHFIFRVFRVSRLAFLFASQTAEAHPACAHRQPLTANLQYRLRIDAVLSLDIMILLAADSSVLLMLNKRENTRTTTDTPRIGHVSHCHRSLWGEETLQRIRKAAVINSTRLAVAQNSNSKLS